MGQLGLACTAGTWKIGLFQVVDLAAAIEREFADASDKALKLFVARDKIGLGVDLDDGADAATGRTPDAPVGAHPPAFFAPPAQPFLSHPVDGSLDLAAALAQRPLAIHHACA